MQVTTLGTGSPLPDPGRAGPATLVRTTGTQLLFDCGRGVVLRLAAAATGPVLLTSVLLTHLHSDHVCDLNDVITTRWAMSPVPAPLEVIGPAGTAALVERTLAMLSDDIGYRRAHHGDLNWDPPVTGVDVADGAVLELGEVTVRVAATDHMPVAPTVGYRVEADGAAVVIGGDSVPCAGLDRLCEGADAYVQTVVRPSLVAQVPSARFQDVLGYHSSIADAASTAARGGVSTLVLTHLVPAPWPGTEPEWVTEAAAHFAGEVVVAHDLYALELGGA